MPIGDGRGGDEHRLDHPAFHARIVDGGKNAHPNRVPHFLKIVRHDGDCRAIAEGGDHFAAGFLADESPASFRRANLGNDGGRFGCDG